MCVFVPEPVFCIRWLVICGMWSDLLTLDIIDRAVFPAWVKSEVSLFEVMNVVLLILWCSGSTRWNFRALRVSGGWRWGGGGGSTSARPLWHPPIVSLYECGVIHVGRVAFLFKVMIGICEAVVCLHPIVPPPPRTPHEEGLYSSVCSSLVLNSMFCGMSQQGRGGIFCRHGPITWGETRTVDQTDWRRNKSFRLSLMFDYSQHLHVLLMRVSYTYNVNNNFSARWEP